MTLMNAENLMFLAKFEGAWQDAYDGEYGRQPGPREVMAFLSDFDEGQDPNEQPRFDYNWLLAYLEQYGPLPETHIDGIRELGWQAAAICQYNEVTEDMFSWGYILYANLAHYYSGYDMPFYSFEYIVNSSFTKPDINEWVRDLAGDAAKHVSMLYGLADAALDGLVAAYNSAGYLDEDNGPGQEYEMQQIRANRLLVVRAGIGQAFRHFMNPDTNAAADWLHGSVQDDY